MLTVLIIANSVCMFLSYSTKGIIAKQDEDNPLLHNLRKQLMHENHDYTETQTIQMRAEIKYNVNKDEANKTVNLKIEKRNGVVRRSKYISEFDEFTTTDVPDESKISYEHDKTYKKPPEHPIALKDLVYYMDEEKLLKDKLGPETRIMTARRSMINNTTDKKYKLLKMRHQYRRQEPRRFIQEENSQGVVVISLDEGPLPEFRLPRSRRQYMHEHGAVAAEEEELPPPPVQSEDAGDDVTPTTVTVSVL